MIWSGVVFEKSVMAPELVTKLIVLDLAYRGDESLVAARHTTCRENQEFLVKWYPLKATPKGFQCVADGVVFVPQELEVDEEKEVTIQCTPRGCTYQDETDILVLVLPRGKTLSWQEGNPPCAAKEFDRRVAVYWLKRDCDHLVEAIWSLPASDDPPQKIAETLNTALELDRGAIPDFFVDDYEHYDVALSYASEDRVHAEAIAKTLKRAGKKVFFDHDVRSRLWGNPLSEELNAIYSRRATYCVLFVSRHYKEKRWTLHELRAAIVGAASTRKRDYILPVQLDDTRLDELPEDIVYTRIAKGSEAICADVLKKLKRL
jgi:hypothetical protein